MWLLLGFLGEGKKDCCLYVLWMWRPHCLVEGEITPVRVGLAGAPFMSAGRWSVSGGVDVDESMMELEECVISRVFFFLDSMTGELGSVAIPALRRHSMFVGIDASPSFPGSF